jgi:copper resistance protein C
MTKLIILVAAISLIGQTAFAHAFLDRASPAVGSTISDAPLALNLTYTEPVEPLFSTVQVTDASGKRVDEGPLKSLESGRVLNVRLRPLPPGAYSVEWHVTSVDTHKTEGHFTFTVKP